MAAGFAYLVAIMGVFSRKVSSWRLSNIQAARFCVEAHPESLLKSVIARKDTRSPAQPRGPALCSTQISENSVRHPVLVS